jgi:hypothetical protein
MDEVDASLDTSTVARVGALLREKSSSTGEGEGAQKITDIHIVHMQIMSFIMLQMVLLYSDITGTRIIRFKSIELLR